MAYQKALYLLKFYLLCHVKWSRRSYLNIFCPSWFELLQKLWIARSYRTIDILCIIIFAGKVLFFSIVDYWTATAAARTRRSIWINFQDQLLSKCQSFFLFIDSYSDVVDVEREFFSLLNRFSED